MVWVSVFHRGSGSRFSVTMFVLLRSSGFRVGAYERSTLAVSGRPITGCALNLWTFSRNLAYNLRHVGGKPGGIKLELLILVPKVWSTQA